MESFTPTACVRAAILKGLPTGWEYSEAVHGFFGPDLVHVEAEPVRSKLGWRWVAFNSDMDWKNFPANKVFEAMAWASTKP